MTNPTHQTEGLRNIGLPLIQVYSKAVQRPTAVKWTKVLYKSCHILTFTHTCTHWWQRLPCRKSACSRGDTALPIQSDAWYIYAQPFTSCLRTLHSKSCNFVQFRSFAIFKKNNKNKTSQYYSLSDRNLVPIFIQASGEIVWMAMSVSSLVGQSSTSVETEMNCHEIWYQHSCCNDFGDALTFHVLPPSSQYFGL